MDCFVLKRAMPGEQNRTRRRGNPQRQSRETQAPQQKAAENRNSYAKGTEIEPATFCP
jgi:hypothetical protein